MHMLLHKKVG